MPIVVADNYSISLALEIMPVNFPGVKQRDDFLVDVDRDRLIKTSSTSIRSSQTTKYGFAFQRDAKVHPDTIERNAPAITAMGFSGTMSFRISIGHSTSGGCIGNRNKTLDEKQTVFPTRVADNLWIEARQRTGPHKYDRGTVVSAPTTTWVMACLAISLFLRLEPC
jgi:hypothetical protein